MDLNQRFGDGESSSSRDAFDHFSAWSTRNSLGSHQRCAAVTRARRSTPLRSSMRHGSNWRAPRNFASTSVLHFKRIAARAMRQLLVEAARRRHADKRGGSVVFITLGDASAAQSEESLLALDDALHRLAKMNGRQAQMMETRFFGGLEMGETAELLGVSEATLLRDWRAAKAWLASELRPSGEV